MPAESDSIDPDSIDPDPIDPIDSLALGEGSILAADGTIDLEELARKSQDAIGRVRSHVQALSQYLSGGEGEGTTVEGPPQQEV